MFGGWPILFTTHTKSGRAGPPLRFFVKVGTTRSAVTAFLWEYVAVKQLRSYAFQEEGAVRIDQWGEAKIKIRTPAA
jgi:hypothetical protein